MSKAKKTKKKKTELFDENDIEEVEPVIEEEQEGLDNIAWQWQQWEDELAGKKKPEQKKKVKLF